MNLSFESKAEEFRRRQTVDGPLGRNRPPQLDHEVNDLRQVLISFLDTARDFGKGVDSAILKVEGECELAAGEARKALDELVAVRNTISELQGCLGTLDQRLTIVEKGLEALEIEVREGKEKFTASVLEILVAFLNERKKTTPGQVPPKPSPPRPMPRPVPGVDQSAPGSYSAYDFEVVTSKGEQYKLKVRAGSFATRSGSLTLGSSPTLAHIHLNDQTVAPTHAILKCQNKKLSIEDQRSATGTAVNGVPLKPFVPWPVNMGETIMLGKLKIRVQICREAGR